MPTSVTSTSIDAIGSSGNITKRKPIVLDRRPSSSNADQTPQSSSPSPPSSSPVEKEQEQPKFNHIYPIHSASKGSILSRESTTPAPSFVGLKNLAMIVLVVSNLRLMIENYAKYGVLLSYLHLGVSKSDLIWTLRLTALIPLHLFVALVIERLVAIPTMKYVAYFNAKQKEVSDKGSSISLSSRANIANSLALLRPKPKHLWRLIVFLHSVNVLGCLWFTTVMVYTKIDNPMMGTACETHAIIVCLKVASFSLTNRDLRESLLLASPAVPELYSSKQYPKNLSVGNLSYFWWAPTLVYQPVYPRSPSFRPLFFIKRIIEVISCTLLILFLSAQYAVPTLENSLQHIHNLELFGILERLFKLASISMAIWLIGFFCVFQSGLNALAEVMRFGDREFYDDWWNSRSVGEYWRLWNKPVTNYFRRHIYVPLVRRGWKPTTASVMVFFVSAVLHEILVGVPTHNIIGVAFVLMLLQIPLVMFTVPLEKINRPWAGTLGNCVFWLSFFIGQPSAVLIYYFSWSVDHGRTVGDEKFALD
ncbi:diacylglycerol O-acyltransferase [Myxozyma melibiosi]|uniref:O-acyltransferase n=1 Tax=Myxozyma melibiosi TaxID=54550 RepID=A0ABR1EYB1_9ASCO